MLTRRTALVFLAGAVAATVAPSVLAAERVPFDRASFDRALKAGGPVLVDVSATWCSTCRAQRRVVDGLMELPPYDAFKTFVVDYDTEKDIMRSFGATQRSTLIVFKGGRETGRIVGDTRPASIEALLAAAV